MKSIAFELGRAVGAVECICRLWWHSDQPLYAIVLGVIVGMLVAETVRTVESSMSVARSTSRNPPPEVSALKRHELTMPVGQPHRRPRRWWPPFEGVRVELGEG